MLEVNWSSVYLIGAFVLLPQYGTGFVTSVDWLADTCVVQLDGGEKVAATLDEVRLLD